MRLKLALVLVGALSFTLAPVLATAMTEDEQLCNNANANDDAHALDAHCPIAAAQQQDLSTMSSDPNEAQNAQLREGGYLFLAAKGALLTMQLQLGAAELSKALSVFKDVRDHGVTKELRTRAMTGIQMVEDTVSRLSHLSP